MLFWLALLKSRSISGFRELGQKFQHHFFAQREIIPASDHLLMVHQQQYQTVQAYTERFDKEAMKVPNLSDREHLQEYKHGLRSLSLTKVLATKRLHLVDDLLDVIHEFIKWEIRVKSKRDHLEGGMVEGRSKRPLRIEVNRRSVRDLLTVPTNRPYSHSRRRESEEH